MLENKHPKIYILILNYNCSQETVELYRNILELYKDEIRILIIDNHSKPSDKDYLKNYIPHSNLILNNENRGYAGGNNVGIDIGLKEKVDYIWILNPDIRLVKDTLPVLLETIKDDPSLAAVGPRILKRENPDVIFTDGEKLLMDEKCSTHQKYHGKSKFEIPATIDYDIDYVDGSCILINAKALSELGNLPEEYFLYFEETDWCYRAKKNGWNLAVNSNANVYNLTSLKKETFHYYFMRNRLIFSKKFHPNYKEVRRYYVKLLLKEFLNRFQGKYLNPFYRSRVKGLVAGIIFVAYKFKND